jgi:hypothetical protein
MPELVSVAPDPAGREVWVCDQCRKTAPWGPGWQWWGSPADLDCGTYGPVACSDRCMALLQEAGRCVERHHRFGPGGCTTNHWGRSHG